MTPRSVDLKTPTIQRATPRPKKNLHLTRNVFWFASWTVVYCPLPASCIYSHVSSPASRVSVGFIIATPDLDRSNLGSARLQGLPADVLHGDPTGKRFDWVNSVFFFSYVSISLCARSLKKPHASPPISTDPMCSSSHHPGQTPSTSTIFRLRGYRLGHLLHAHG